MKNGRAGFLLLLVSVTVAVMLQLLVLPEWMRSSRPYWLPLVLSYWALTQPGGTLLLVSAIAGLGLDVAFGTALGQHALANVVLVYLIARLRTLFVLLDTWQVMFALAPLWALYVFILFWLDGLTNRSADPTLRWMPIIATTLIWPAIYGLLKGFQRTKRED